MVAQLEPPSLNIRIQGTNEWVVLSYDSFPTNPYDLIYLLKVETAPRSAWLQAAATYLRLNNLEHCITVLEIAVSDNVDAMLPKEALTRLDLLAALAGGHIMHASSSRDPQSREKHLRAAADVFLRADTLNVDYPAIWATRGWADFHAAKSLSSTWFDHAVTNGLVLGAIGLAALYLNRPSKADPKKDPVSLLVSALRAKFCPPGVWTALGYALYKEGRLSTARKVTVRAISALRSAVDDEKREAFYLLALIGAAAREEGSLNSMSIALAEAYSLNGQRDSRVLSLISHMFFSSGDFAKAELFAKRAIDAAEDAPGATLGAMFGGLQSSAKAEALFQLARAQHHLDRTDEAIFNLENVKALCDAESSATKPNPGIFLRLGLLKLATGRKEAEQVSQECLERVLKESNDRSGIAKRALGVLLGRKILLGLRRGRPLGGENFNRAVDLLRQGLDDGSDGKKDVPAQLVYAALVEEFYPKKALIAYREAIATLEERKEEVDAEIWNNFSSILARLGQIGEAQEMAEKIDDSYKESCAAVKYNRGRLAEMARKYDEAKSIYRTFKSDALHYSEACVRLAIILMSEPEGHEEAEKLLIAAKDTPKTKAAAVLYLSKLYISQKNFTKAQQVLEDNRFDSDYLSLAFTSFMHRFLSFLEEGRRSRFLTNHIGHPLVSILKRGSRNVAAANGVGVYFAEWKLFAEARDAFVAAGSGQKADHASRINLAHIRIQIGLRELRDSAKYTGRPSRRAITSATGLFEQAAKTYSDALEVSSPTGDDYAFRSYCELLLYLGWAQFEARKFEDSVQTLTKLVHLMPTNGVAWFNLGHALFESASERVRTGMARLKEMEIATKEYAGSKNALNRSGYLVNPRDREDEFAKAIVKRSDVAAFERYVRQRAKTHDVGIRNAKLKAEDEALKQRKRAEDMKKEQEKEERMRLEREKERIKKEEELREAFEESLRKQKQYDEQHKLLQEHRQKKQAEDEDDPWEEEGTGTTPKRKRRKKKEEDFIVDDGDEVEEKPRKRRATGKRKVAEGSGSEYSDVPDDEDGGNQVNNESDERTDGATKRRRFNLQDDDDDELSEGGF